MATSNNKNTKINQTSDFSRKNLETMTVADLRTLATQHNLHITTRMKKNEIIDILFTTLGLTTSNLENLSVPELKHIATTLNLSFLTKIKKQELITLIQSSTVDKKSPLQKTTKTKATEKTSAIENEISVKKAESKESITTSKKENKQQAVLKLTDNQKQDPMETNQENKITKELAFLATLSLSDLKKHAQKKNYKFNPRSKKVNIIAEIEKQLLLAEKKPVNKPTHSKIKITEKTKNKTQKDLNDTEQENDTEIKNATSNVIHNNPPKKNDEIKYSPTLSNTQKQTEKKEQDAMANKSNTQKHTIEKKTTASSKIKNTIRNDAPPKEQKKNKKKGRLGRILWRMTCVLFIFIFIGTLVATHFVYQYYLDVQSTLPPLSIHKIENKMKGNTGVYDVHDQFVDNLAEASYVAVTYDELPQSLIDAINGAEDARFLRHNGIDGPRTIQAVVRNLIADDITGGGSTISQQLIKETSLKDKINKEGSEYKHSNERKIHEWILSYQLEQQMSKEDILTAYFNTLGYGRFTGVGTAAKRYFNKSVSELTTAEAILLAGIPQASTDNDPYQHMDTAKKRFDTVSGLLHKHEYITNEELIAIRSLPLADLLLTDQYNSNYNYFSGVQNELHELFNITAGEEVVDSLPFYTGYKIYTELDQEQQSFANQILDTNDFVNFSEMLANLGIYEDDINLQAAFTVVNTETGGIPAIGAARRFDEVAINFALTGKRSPGSAIKPVIDYAPGMEKLGWTPFTAFQDKKTYYTGSAMQVSNFGGSSGSGKAVPLQSAVSQSLNTTAVQAIQQVGVDYAGRFANDLGISSAGEHLENGTLFESAALGGGIDTTTTEMAGAYATFANAGQYNKPHFIRRIENSDGDVIYEYKRQNTQVMSPNTAKLMTDVLKYTRWSGTPASYDRSQVDSAIEFAAKTGTSSYSDEQIRENGLSYYSEKDHWIVGYSPQYSIAVWTGFNIENNEVLQKTRGNQNSSKSYGSHIMAAWINTFSPAWTGFNFDREYNSLASLSGLAVTHDEYEHIIDWKEPRKSYPTIMENDLRNALGSVVYDVYAAYEDEDEELIIDNIPSDESKFDYSSLIKGDKNFTIRIVARFSAHNDGLSQKSEIKVPIRMKVKTVDDEKEETTTNNA